ncbi:MAG: methylated-DNA--[protein]-cysteine S-methyltransferase [Candidatus Kerfeldbacteria bacterium]|nr:methylated-DNA--[protein]-cysteine S-methyltransferase [Candidatus Kerfeldbacteria bacterium]
MGRGQNLYFRIYNMVRRVPRGRVATYGQIAALIGSPRSARVVGWALRALEPDTKVPWQRVINKDGMISIENMHTPKSVQVELLRREGVEVAERQGNFWVELNHYLWRP